LEEGGRGHGWAPKVMERRPGGTWRSSSPAFRFRAWAPGPNGWCALPGRWIDWWPSDSYVVLPVLGGWEYPGEVADAQPTITDEVERYLRTVHTDPHLAAWPGGFLERARRAHDDLRDALVREVRRLAAGRGLARCRRQTPSHSLAGRWSRWSEASFQEWSRTPCWR